MLKKWMPLTFLLLMFAVSGCQNNSNNVNEKANDLRNDTSAPNSMSSHGNGRNAPENANNRNKIQNTVDDVSDRGKNKQHYVENDITNQNPNFLDLGRTGSGGEAGANNHGNDINQAKQVIASTDEFKTDSVWINGDRMWVSVYKKGMFSDKTRTDAEARLHKKLIQALPRYNIEVRVQEDRR